MLFQCWSTVFDAGPTLKQHLVNLYLDRLIYLNFQLLEIVSRYRDPQPEVVENYYICLILAQILGTKMGV